MRKGSSSPWPSGTPRTWRGSTAPSRRASGASITSRRSNRAALSASAVDAGQACLERAPESALCHYALALGLGVQARERRATATDGMKKMVEHLRRAKELDPRIDEGGPDRVLAVLLTRAPAWPVGPGNPEGAVQEARRAVEIAPDYPPNLLALSEALLDTGGTEEGRGAARRAVELSRSSREPDAVSWAAEGERLEKLPARASGARG